MPPILFVAALTLTQPPAAGPPRFAVSTASGRPVTGRVERLLPKWGAKIGDPDATVPPGDLIGLANAGRPRPPLPGGPQLVLANGDRIPGTLAGGDDLAVTITPAVSPGKAGATWRVPLAQVRVLWLEAPPAEYPIDPDRYPWLTAGRKKDVVLFRNGDTLSGDIERFAGDGRSLTWKPPGGKGSAVLDLSLVSAVALNPTLVAGRKPRGPYARVVTADGTRVSVSAAEGDGARVNCTATFGAKFDLPLAELAALDVLQGKAVYLSDLKPARATTEGYGELTWPWRSDRSAKGDPLRLVTPRGEETFDKGLGTHPRTTLVYPLGKKYRRFEATVGLDAATGRRGAAAVRILVDGKEHPAPELARLSAAGGAVPVSVDVSRAGELTLVVDFGPAGDVQADVDWADARLVE